MIITITITISIVFLFVILIIITFRIVNGLVGCIRIRVHTCCEGRVMCHDIVRTHPIPKCFNGCFLHLIPGQRLGV